MANNNDEFIVPEFLQHNSTEEIRERMMNELPKDIDKMVGGYPWDLCNSVAQEKARMVEFTLTEAIKNIVPQFADEPFLTWHGKSKGINKRPASNSRTTLTVTGVADTVIPKGFKFSTESTLDEAGVVFITDEETEIDETETAQVAATAEIVGPMGNVGANRIILQLKPLKGITGVTNANASYGGFDEESEDNLRQRIIEYDKMQGESFVGSKSDFRRWAMSVVGVGDAKPRRAEDDSGTVIITVTDTNGQPADENLCNAVYDYIMRPNAEYESPRNINANVRVIPPQTSIITITASIITEQGHTIDTIKADFVKNMQAYFTKTQINGVVRYSEMCAVLVDTLGVADYRDVTMNGSTRNIEIGIGEMATISAESVTFTESTEA